MTFFLVHGPILESRSTRLNVELRLLARSATQYTFNLDFCQYDRKLAITCM